MSLLPESLNQSILAVIPVAGRPELLKEALDSVRRQSVPPDRVVVVVNSRGAEREQDRLAAEKSFEEEWPSKTRREIRIAETPGPSAARNRGVEGASESWVAFLDSDDLWHPEKLQKQMDYLRKRPHLKGVHTRERWIKKGKELPVPERLQPAPGTFLEAALEQCMISPSSLLLRVDFLKELGGFDESFIACEDYELWIRFLLKAPAGLLLEPLTIKRSGEWFQQSSLHSLDALRIQAILKNMERFSGDHLPLLRHILETKLRIGESGARKHGTEEFWSDLRCQVKTELNKKTPPPGSQAGVFLFLPTDTPGLKKNQILN